MGRNHLLDGLRGVAAIAVLLYHIGRLLDLPVMPGGYLAVDFFFALSGYVLAMNYTPRLLKGWGVSRFMAARVARLYPVFLVGMALGVVKVAAEYRVGLVPQEIARAFWANVLMLPAPEPRTFPFNGPSWSLFCEMVIGLWFAAALFKTSTRALAGIAALTGAALVAVVLQHGNINLGWNLVTLPAGLARATYGFCAGILIARLGWASNARRWAPLLGLVLLGVFSLPDSAARDLSFALVGSPLVILVASALDVTERLRPAASRLGALSYPLYAVHWPVVTAVVFAGMTLHLPVWVTAALGLLMPVVAAAIVAWIYYFALMRAAPAQAKR